MTIVCVVGVRWRRSEGGSARGVPRRLRTGVKVGEDDVDKHALRRVAAAIFLLTNIFARITEIVHRDCSEYRYEEGIDEIRLYE